MTRDSLEDFATEMGLALSGMLPAILQHPPTSREAARDTINALMKILEQDTALGAPKNARMFLWATIVGLQHWVDPTHAMSEIKKLSEHGSGDES